MKDGKMGRRIARCGICGSPDVTAVLPARWNIDTQDWRFNGGAEVRIICGGCRANDIPAVYTDLADSVTAFKSAPKTAGSVAPAGNGKKPFRAFTTSDGKDVSMQFHLSTSDPDRGRLQVDREVTTDQLARILAILKAPAEPQS